MAVAGAVTCALASWVSFGLMAVVSDGSSPRIGVLPPMWLPAAVGAGLIGLACWRLVPDAVWRAALLPSVLLLPWLPFRVPAAFLLWTGPVVWLVWIGTGIAAVAALAAGKAWPRSRFSGGGTVFAISLAVYAVAAWTSSAVRPIGDEPQYLIITQSLLLDGDLQIENNHKRADYASYYSGVLRPDYLRRGVDGQIYSIHAPGLPALVAPAFALGGYPAVVVFLLFVSALGAWLVWRTALTLAGSVGAAWFGWSSVCLSVPFLCHSGAVFPDGPGAVLVMVGVAALVQLERETQSGTIPAAGGRFFWQGVALAALPWLHTRFAAAAAVLGACLALRLIQRRRFGALAAFAAVPIVSAVAWFGFFYIVYGSVNPAAPYGAMSQSTLANLWPGLPALLLDQQFGLLPNAPVYAVALAGLGLLFRSHRRLAVELTVLLLVYLSAVASYNMWWGGWSAPARFAVPVLLALGPCAAAFWARGGATARAVALLALSVSLYAGGVAATVDGGRIMLNARDGVTRWLEWLCPLVDLPRGLPSFFWAGAPRMMGDAAIWAAVLLAGWLVLWWFARRRDDRSLPLATPALFLGVVMLATTTVWLLHDEAVITPTSAQLHLLDRIDPAAQPLGVQYRPFRLRPSEELVGRLRVSVSTRRPQPANAPPFSIRNLPAGTYRVVEAASGARRDLAVAVNKSPLPLQRCAFATPAPGDCLIHLPVDLVELKIGAADGSLSSADARRLVAMQPIDPLPSGARPTRLKAMMAASYGRTSAFAFDERVFLEPSGLWVEGGEEVPLVLAASDRRATIRALFRNGAVENTIHVRGALTGDLAFAPREEKIVEIPIDARSRAAFLSIRADRGFRPSQMEPNSRDPRYLGIWLEIPAD